MKRKIISILFAVVLVLTLSLVTAVPVAAATDYYVATTGSDTTGDGTSGNPWATIQHAIDQCTGGETVIVAAGIYTESLLINGVDVSLIAVGDVTIRVPVPYQGPRIGSYSATIQIYNSTCAIDGFTVVGGDLGIYASGAVNVTIRNNTVEEYLKNGDRAVTPTASTLSPKG